MSSSTSAYDFLEKLENDASFRTSLSNAPDPAGKANVIRDAGFVFTPEELNAAISDQETSQSARDYALNAVSNIAPDNLQAGALGGWMWFSCD